MISFTIDDAIRILSKTPGLLRQYISDLPDNWIYADEGLDTFSLHEVLGHLIIGEKTDWIPRMNIILEEGVTRPFDAFDRFAHREIYEDVQVATMLDEFQLLRQENIEILRNANLNGLRLDREGMHPVLGKVTLRSLLCAWVAHDMAHLAQISRIIAKQYGEDVGAFRQFLNILNDRAAPHEMDYDWSQFVLRIPIKGTPDELFNAFITPNALKKWFLREAIFIKTDRSERDADEPIMEGDQYTFLWHGWDDGVMENGVVLEQSNHCLRFTIFGDCIVTIKLLQLPEICLVELTQGNMPTDDASKAHFHHNGTKYWSFYLTNLKSVLEGGLDLRNRDENVLGVLNM